ncbi:acyltransferase family protein [Pseudomonas donghuensis]|uniref:acyltransferase family protein n=1 Tax=Pseudomonas donghuensis TaxID=1163398 RepID=UPI00029AAAD2|nr:acyltransferase [Pseudomonas donghuensis]
MIRNIQLLRFVAAALVVFAHSPLNLYGVSPSFIKLGGFGVDIFFIISGFIIPFILFSNNKTNNETTSTPWTTFIKRRIYRVWPLYFILSIFVVVTSYLIAGSQLAAFPEISVVYGSDKLNPMLILESLTFTHDAVAPIINVGWTLQLEFAFYFTVAIILGLGVRKYESLVLWYTAVLIISALLSSYLTKIGALTDNALYRPLRVMSSPMMIEFLLGMVVYRLYRNEIYLSKIPATLAAIIVIPLFIYAEANDIFMGLGGAYHRPMVWGVFAFITVWSAISLEKTLRAPKVLSILGDSSYSLYLMHWLALPWIAYFITTKVGMANLNSISLLVINIIVCQAIAIAVHKYIEKPINNSLRASPKTQPAPTLAQQKAI